MPGDHTVSVFRVGKGRCNPPDGVYLMTDDGRHMYTINYYGAMAANDVSWLFTTGDIGQLATLGELSQTNKKSTVVSQRNQRIGQLFLQKAVSIQKIFDNAMNELFLIPPGEGASKMRSPTNTTLDRVDSSPPCIDSRTGHALFCFCGHGTKKQEARF